jgi:arginine repressor
MADKDEAVKALSDLCTFALAVHSVLSVNCKLMQSFQCIEMVPGNNEILARFIHEQSDKGTIGCILTDVSKAQLKSVCLDYFGSW